MKKVYMLMLGVLCWSVQYGQSYSDDFESYAVGSDIGGQGDWTTWSGDNGGADDCQVTDDQASSGSNSLYLMTTSANGGPDDIVLPLTEYYSSGIFTLEFNMRIEADNGAYLNFQGAPEIGVTWALDLYFVEDGTWWVGTQGTEVAASTFTADTWFNIEILANMSENTWEVFMDDTSVGSFTNPENSVGSINFYPWNNDGNGNASFWIDDVSWSHTGPISVEEEKAQDLVAYPNPVEDVLNINLDEDSSVMLYDLQGRMVYSESVMNQSVHQIDLDGYESGVYTLVVSTDSASMSQRIVKK